MDKDNKTASVPITETAEEKFVKESFLKSSKYIKHRDVLDVLLNDGEYYTIDEVDKKIKDFMNKEVK